MDRRGLDPDAGVYRNLSPEGLSHEAVMVPAATTSVTQAGVFACLLNWCPPCVRRGCLPCGRHCLVTAVICLAPEGSTALVLCSSAEEGYPPLKCSGSGRQRVNR